MAPALGVRPEFLTVVAGNDDGRVSALSNSEAEINSILEKWKCEMAPAIHFSGLLVPVLRGRMVRSNSTQQPDIAVEL